jgi:hypothetical protein
MSTMLRWLHRLLVLALVVFAGVSPLLWSQAAADSEGASLLWVNSDSWPDGDDTSGSLDFSEAELAATNDYRRLRVTMRFYPPFDGTRLGAEDSVQLFMDTDRDWKTGIGVGSPPTPPTVTTTSYPPARIGSDYTMSIVRVPGPAPYKYQSSLFKTPSDDPSTWERLAVQSVSVVTRSTGEVQLQCFLPLCEISYYPVPIVIMFRSAYVLPVGKSAEDLVANHPVTLLYSTPFPTYPPCPSSTTTLSSTTTSVIPKPSFSDVLPLHPYFAEIQRLAALGVVVGVGQGEFRPDDPVWRQQFAKMIVLTMGYPVSEADVCRFGDVETPADDLYPDNYIAVCADRAITLGTRPGEFSPWNEISRAQLITMVSRAAGLQDPPPEYAPPFGDFSSTHYPWARRALFAGLLDGLEGVGAGYDFWASATRGEVCALLSNLLDR